MWLVIAALILSTAIQTIGYYQQAAYLSNMKTGLDGIASRVMATSAMGSGAIDVTTAKEAVRLAAKTPDIKVTVEKSSLSNKPYVRASHPAVEKVDVVYLFESCQQYVIGVNILPKGGDAACGISQSPPDPMKIEVTETPALGTYTWRAASISGDGNVMVAGTDGGTIRTSKDAGQSWLTHSEISPDTTWRGMAASYTGDTLLAGKNNGPIYLSRDRGVTWQPQTTLGNGAWRAVHVSSDGSKLIASMANSGLVWYSSDSGATWTSKAAPGGGNTAGVTASDDGANIYMVNYGDKAYVSRDGGSTWQVLWGAARSSAWSDIATSADGQTIVTGSDTAWMLTSTDYGRTWIEHDELEKASWRAVSISADGSTMLAVKFNSSSLFTSSDYGQTWDESKNAANNYLTGEISDDGTKAIFGGGGTLKFGALQK